MWVYSNDFKKWTNSTDSLLISDFNYLKQQLLATRFYSKYLSGSTYIPIHDVNNIYDIMGEWQPRNWYLSTLDAPYSASLSPNKFPKSIDNSSSYDYYTKFISEYGLTLKNLFTPDRLINDSLNNYISVDVASTTPIDLTLLYTTLSIDGVNLQIGNTILLKDQITTITLDSSIDPNTYFVGNYTITKDLGTIIEYQYYNSENGLYVYNGQNLVKQSTLDDYKNCIRFSVYIKAGTLNVGKQFFLSRLLNGYFPTSSKTEPMEFTVGKNWILRNRVDYHNIFDVNYNDVIKRPSSNYVIDNLVYSVPERTISIGDFGIIINTQGGVSNIIPNKYKETLRSITDTSGYYWVCGDNSTLLKIRKHDFNIENVSIDNLTNLTSISFFDDLRGVVVGDVNIILLTVDGGNNWKRLRISDFDSFNYNKVIFTDFNKFYIGGNNGVFIDVEENINGWTAHRRRISKDIDDEDEYLLVDNINDLYYLELSDWNLNYNYKTDSILTDKIIILLVTDNGNIVVYDVNGFNSFNFLYLDFGKNYGDIINIVNKENTTEFYFTNNDGLYSFDLTNFVNIGVDNIYSNTIVGVSATLESNLYANQIFDYNGGELLLVGNNGLMQSSSYSSPFNFEVFDSNFTSRLKSKMLFLDYDIASKLNFFDDQGNYILPNSLSFDMNKYSSVDSINYNSTLVGFPLNIPRSGSDSINIPSNVNLYTGFSVSIDLNHNYIGDLAINLVKSDNNGDIVINLKNYGVGGDNKDLVNVNFTTDSLASDLNTSSWPYSGSYKISGIIGVNTVDVSNTSSFEDMIPNGNIGGTWKISIKDNVGRDVCELINWSISFEIGSSFVSFNPILHPAVAPSNISKLENNWWTYKSDYEKTFEYWSGSQSDANAILISSTFSFYNEYSNNFPYELNISNVVTNIDDLLKLAPGITYSGTTYSSRFDIVNNLQINLNINVPNYLGPGGTIYLYDYLMIIETDINWEVEKGDLLRLECDLIDGNFLVNKILTINNRKFIYVYTEFNDNIINNLVYSNISIFNLNRYDSTDRLVSNFENHPLGIAYDMTQNGNIINVVPLFNNLTSYYNLGAIVGVNGIYSTMSYETGFLSFGYTPNYNILDYLESVNKDNNNPTFYAIKEYLSMPNYENIPFGELTTSTAYIDVAGLTYSKSINKNQNFIVFGSDLALEWESIFINTFVDITIVEPSGDEIITEKLLVLSKYQVNNYLNSGIDAYIIEFNKKINYTLNSTLNGGTLKIHSRRTLKEISDDLQELNNIQKPKSKITTINDNVYSSYETELKSKIPTDSYAKILLSDVDTVSELSALLYIDYKNDLAMNITKLDREYEIQISNTINNNGFLYINCSEKHGLSVNDGVVLEFNGGINSSEYLNRDYFGYHIVTEVFSPYDFTVDVSFGNQIYVGSDIGTVKYLKKDPFLNYEPVDLIEVGLDRKVNTGILLKPENTLLMGGTFSLYNVDYTRYRYRLIDGLTIDTLNLTFPWILEAEIRDAVIGLDDSGLIWYKGIWESGRWFEGTWTSGTWISGDWYGGTWNSNSITDNILSVVINDKSSNLVNSEWITGRWYDGTWNNGTWNNGRWYGGTWVTGNWYNGTWNNGTWNNGIFSGGIWVNGTWNNGIFNTDSDPAYWLDGTWNGGDFENGIWYDGIFGGNSTLSRFGTNAFNSRTAIWYGGKWKSGSFHSRLNEVNGIPDVSDVHKYSIWYSGDWLSGDWYGGIAYNMNFSTGIWHGGILEEIEVIGINSKNNSFILNGHFKFNIGDEIYIIDNNNTNEFSKYGSNSNPTKYVILNIVEDLNYKITEVYVDDNIDTFGLSSYRKNSGTLSLPIPNTSSEIVSTQSIYYDVTTTSELRVKLNLTNNNIGDLIINLKSPNGTVVNIKDYGMGGTMSIAPSIVSDPWIANPDNSMINTIFTSTHSTNVFETDSSPYTNTYEMSKNIGVGATPFYSNFTGTDLSSLLGASNSVIGDWSLYIKDMHPDLNITNSATYSINASFSSIMIRSNVDYTSDIRIGDSVRIIENNLSSPNFTDITTNVTKMEVLTTGIVKTLYLETSATSSTIVNSNYCDLSFSSNPNKNNILIDWELEFVNNHEVGAQIGYKIEDGFDLGLRVVSKFKNVNWKSGIWTNGIYDSGIFEGGIWYNGIFNGDWG
jgi:subtilisin-like proprotein convertase family protein